MNSKDFTYILQNPQDITHEQTEGIKSIIDEFPYFQPARAIYLKGLKNQSSINYNQALKTTAAYTTDRSILFDFITSETFIQNKISKFIKQNSSSLKDFDVEIETVSSERTIETDPTLDQQIKDTEGVLDPELFSPKEPRPPKKHALSLNKAESTEETTSQAPLAKASPEDVLNLGQPLQFNKQEKHSFNEWLKLTQFKPIDRTDNSSKAQDNSSKIGSSEKEHKFKLIDKFISENPKINPTKPITKKGNLAKAQMIKPEALMTETLARIYVEQKNYKKAIHSYKILSLKYPEKSGFFANQIKAVEQLQEQNNKE